MMGGKWAQMWGKDSSLVESFILFHSQRTVDCIFSTKGEKLSFLSAVCHILTVCAVLDCFALRCTPEQ